MGRPSSEGDRRDGGNQGGDADCSDDAYYRDNYGGGGGGDGGDGGFARHVNDDNGYGDEKWVVVTDNVVFMLNHCGGDDNNDDVCLVWFSHAPFREVGSERESWRKREQLDLMHGRSRMAIDPRIPTMPGGACRLFTDQADIGCTKREAP